MTPEKRAAEVLSVFEHMLADDGHGGVARGVGRMIHKAIAETEAEIWKRCEQLCTEQGVGREKNYWRGCMACKDIIHQRGRKPCAADVFFNPSAESEVPG